MQNIYFNLRMSEIITDVDNIYVSYIYTYILFLIYIITLHFKITYHRLKEPYGSLLGA